PRPVHGPAGGSHLRTPGRRQPGADVLRIRVRECRHGHRPAARCRRALATNQLRRHLDGDAHGGFRYSHERSFSPQVRVALMKSQCLAPGRALAALSLLVSFAASGAEDYRTHSEFAAFATAMQTQGFSEGELDRLFDGVTWQQAIIDAIMRPAESKDWHEYRPIFLTAARIDGGKAFHATHRELLARAEREFGVDAEIIAAIIGVETFYGRITGSWRVIDALATLGFDYPPRGAFFRGELEQFLLLTREEAIDAQDVEGSYA